MGTKSTNLPVLRVPASALLPANGQWDNRFEIRSESSDRVYVVAQNKGKRHWACGCPGWIYKRGGKPRACKHLKAIARGLGLPEDTLCGERPFEMALTDGSVKPAPVKADPKPRALPKPKATRKATSKPEPKKGKECCGGSCKSTGGNLDKLRARLRSLVEASETISEAGLAEYDALEAEIDSVRARIRELRSAA